jgi:hypothetical protein
VYEHLKAKTNKQTKRRGGGERTKTELAVITSSVFSSLEQQRQKSPTQFLFKEKKK